MVSHQEQTLIFKPPNILIYKTSKDYSQNVPVTLSEDKRFITSYPGQSDVFYKNKLALPTQLIDGYLIDNRGINPNTAFLSIKYEDYSKLPENLSTSKMMEMIIDNDPMLEIYNCGYRPDFKDEVKELNALIKSGGLSKCKCLKAAKK